MIKQTLRDKLALISPDSIILDSPSFDDSILGTTETGQIIYSYYNMVCELAKDNHIKLEDAQEFIDYNTLRSIPYMGDMAPVICYEDCIYE